EHGLSTQSLVALGKYAEGVVEMAIGTVGSGSLSNESLAAHGSRSLAEATAKAPSAFWMEVGKLATVSLVGQFAPGLAIFGGIVAPMGYAEYNSSHKTLSPTLAPTHIEAALEELGGPQGVLAAPHVDVEGLQNFDNRGFVSGPQVVARAATELVAS